VQHQAHLLWPWLLGMLPAAGVVFALDGVLIGAGDVVFLRTITIVAAVAAFAPLNVAALHWHWGIGGVWAGLSAFILVRFAGMVLRTRGERWLVIGEAR
jgi:Na+-driven multidrug efflux pump